MTSVAYGIGFPAVRGVLTPPRTQGGGPSPLLDGLVAYWAFDEASGATTADATGNGNTGTLINGPTRAAGKINGGINFASNQYVNIGNNPALNFFGAMPFTLAGWGKRTTTAIGVMFDGITGSAGYRVDVGQAFSAPAGAVLVYMGGAWSWSNSGIFIDTDWHHVAVVYDGSNLTFYNDGAFDHSSAAAAPTSVSMNRSIGNIVGTSNPFGGVLDEFGIWGRALDAAEITALYNGGMGLQYPF